MPLNKDIMGMALYLKRSSFNNRTMEDLITEYGTMENVLLEMCKADAEVIVNHIKQNGVVNTTGTAAAQTGTMT